MEQTEGGNKDLEGIQTLMSPIQPQSFENRVHLIKIRFLNEDFTGPTISKVFNHQAIGIGDFRLKEFKNYLWVGSTNDSNFHEPFRSCVYSNMDKQKYNNPVWD